MFTYVVELEILLRKKTMKLVLLIQIEYNDSHLMWYMYLCLHIYD